MTKSVVKSGMDLLRDCLLNKGTAFTTKEREEFSLNGLLPATYEPLEEQVSRHLKIYHAKKSGIGKHIYLRSIQDRNEVLFYRLLLDNLNEMMPIIYTSIVGKACQCFSQIYRQPRGLFLSYPEQDKMDSIIASIAANRDIRVIVVTDGERVLGLGDLGIGGLGISIGKLSLYTSCGGINPSQTLPIVLDVGTNNEEKLKDNEYLGWRHERITGQDYYHFLERFVQSIKKYMPKVLLQFEDFAQTHAYPLLQKYQDQLCTFNDDIQGTAAVTASAIIAATSITKTNLTSQCIVSLGSGSAGCGISELLVNMMINQGLSEEEALSRFYLLNSKGLLETSNKDLTATQRRFAKDRKDLSHWTIANQESISLFDVVLNAKPTILLGVCGQRDQFTEKLVRTMASFCQRPIIFPLSNPNTHCEATPSDLLNWSEGRALIATGSPFGAVSSQDTMVPISQCNNVYIFPGIGLAVVAGQVRRITNTMMIAAAIALSELAPSKASGIGPLLPPLSSIRTVSKHIAKALIKAAIKEGHANFMSDSEIDIAIDKTMWEPNYQSYL